MFAGPLLLVLALAVKLTSRGPVFYRQARVGRRGTEFRMIKLRTMVDGADRLLHEDENLLALYLDGGHKIVSGRDPRVTRLGKLLRKSSLDELPQLINVIKGDMSMVGPRPVTPQQLESYGDLVHAYLGVQPGITGMWQVSGRCHVAFPERAHLDHDYFRNGCFRRDLWILARTPIAVLRGLGAV